MGNLRSLMTAILGVGGAIAGALVSIAVAMRLIRRPEPGPAPPAPPEPVPAPPADGGPPGGPTLPGEPPAPALLPPARPGWVPVTEPLPAPTYWPAVLALAIIFLGWGLITGYLLSLVGLLLGILAVAGWIGDLRHEQHDHEG